MPKQEYKNWVDGDGLTLVSAWCRNGLTEEEISNKIGVTRQTIHNWKKKFPDFEKALLKSKEIYDSEIEETLFKVAKGYYIEEEKETVSEFLDKTTIKNKKYIKPDTTALIFWLQNRKPETWRDKRINNNNNRKDDDVKKGGVVILPEILEIDEEGDNDVERKQ